MLDNVSVRSAVSDVDKYQTMALIGSMLESEDGESNPNESVEESSNYEDEASDHYQVFDDESECNSDRPESSQDCTGALTSDGELSQFGIHRANVFTAYRDFDKNNDRFHVLNNFNWEDHAYSVLQKYDRGAAQAINRQSEFAFDMTNNCYGSEQVKSTLPMRNAIVRYLMSIHGIVDKYFKYELINTYLHRDFKAYSKKLMTDPKSIQVDDFVSQTLTAEERCHVSIIVMEAKKRVELIYFSRTLS